MRASSLLKLASALLAAVIITGCHHGGDTKGGGNTTTDTNPSTKGMTDNRVSPTDNTMAGKKCDFMACSSGNIVYFDFDQDTIRMDAREVLLAQAARLKQSGAKARLEGNCDERGTREYNMALGERRAKAVRDFLVLQGVDKTKLEVISYGEEKPADPRHNNEEAYAKNRRVEIK